MFLDYDKDNHRFYNNYYEKDYKIVLKIPIFKDEEDIAIDPKLEKFDLTKYTYLIHYD